MGNKVVSICGDGICTHDWPTGLDVLLLSKSKIIIFQEKKNILVIARLISSLGLVLPMKCWQDIDTQRCYIGWMCFMIHQFVIISSSEMYRFLFWNILKSYIPADIFKYIQQYFVFVIHFFIFIYPAIHQNRSCV